MVKSRYHHPALNQLKDQQAKFAPTHTKMEQMDRAEQLLGRIDTTQSYTYRSVHEAITGFRPDQYPDLMVTGEELQHDLRLFVEDLSASLNIPVEDAGEPVFTVGDLSEKYNVSTKTVSRWRQRGLVSRKFKFGNRSRVGFLRSSVDRFVKENHQDVDRGANFTHLSDTDKTELVLKARRLAAHGASPSETVEQLSKTLKRSPELVRYTLKNYDAENPENAVFPMASIPLTPERKQEIYQRYQQGTPVEKLTEEFQRTRTSIYRVVAEVRAELVLSHNVDYMDSPEFHEPGADKVILGLPPEVDKKGTTTKTPPGLPNYLASLYTVPLLTREEEGYYFRKMNYLKFKALELQQKIDPKKPSAKKLDKFEQFIAKAVEVKNFLIRSNLRLVVSIAKRHMKPTTNFFEMVSDGNMSLIRAIEKFDYTKGNKFSTYASWAIMKNYARSIPKEYKVLDRFRTGNEEVFQFSKDNRSYPMQEVEANAQQHQLIMSILDQLDDRERSIILHRFGLERGSEPETLEQVGTRFGVTKERIRQIESRTMDKIRKIAAAEKLDIPGI